MSDAPAGYRMVSLDGSSTQQIENIIESYNKSNGCTATISNYNSDTQTIVVIEDETFLEFENYIMNQDKDIICKSLPLPYPFHTDKMKKCASQFFSFLKKIEIHDPLIKVISNVTGLPFNKINIKNNLVEQMYSPVHFTNCIHYSMLNGCKKWVEFGPKNILGRIVQNSTSNHQIILAKDYILSSGDKKIYLESVPMDIQEYIEYCLRTITTYPTKKKCNCNEEITKNYNMLKKIYHKTMKNNVHPNKMEVESIFIETMKKKGYSQIEWRS